MKGNKRGLTPPAAMHLRVYLFFILKTGACSRSGCRVLHAAIALFMRPLRPAQRLRHARGLRGGSSQAGISNVQPDRRSGHHGRNNADALSQPHGQQCSR
jgi:hypothetical protein